MIQPRLISRDSNTGDRHVYSCSNNYYFLFYIPAALVPCSAAEPDSNHQAQTAAGEVEYLHRGLREISVSGTAFIPNDSPADTFGLIALRGGYFISRNSEVGVDTTLFAYSRIQDAYLSGFYRLHFPAKGRKLIPFVGVAAGSNIVHFEFWGGAHPTLIAKGEAGLKYVLGKRFTLDAAYNLMYRRNSEVGFTSKTSSVVTVGFSWGF